MGSRTRSTRRSTCGWTRRRTSPRPDIVNEAAERELATIFRRYGEERFARQIAKAIARRRRERPFERTGDLVETIKAAIPAPRALRRRPSGEARLPGAPYRRERRARLARGPRCPAAFKMLRPGGRLAVISSTRSRTGRQALHARPGARAASVRRTSRCASAGRNRNSVPRPVRPFARARRRGRRTRARPRHDCASESRPDGNLGRRSRRAGDAASRNRARFGASAVSRAACSGSRSWQPFSQAWSRPNVAVLRLNMKLDRLGRERADLKAQTAALSSQLSSAADRAADPTACGETARSRPGPPRTRRPTRRFPH